MNPKIMFVRVSENCNAGCFMCHFAHSHGLYNITDEQFDKLLASMKQTGSYEMVRFTGGEPLLHPHIVNFVEKCKSEGYETSIITNGYLLPAKAKELATAGLDQVIISIDGSKPEIHDKLRGLNGGLKKIHEGVNKIRAYKPDIVVRANTVVSDFNIDDLCDLYNLLDNMNFNSWSIIPIRPTEDPGTKWNSNNLKHNIEVYKKFLENQKLHPNISLLGYSNKWAGESCEEIVKTFSNEHRVMPREKCHLVDYVRFYIPDKELLVPCNCAAHRITEIEAEYNEVDDIYTKADIMAKWLKDNAINHCTGCEPLNAYAAENPKILRKGLFKY